jgi:nucleoid-associated protein YgaU
MPKTITVTGADRSLFHVAARQLGDATEWVRIADANGISDPMIAPGAVTLTIPDPTPVKSGGIPSL